MLQPHSYYPVQVAGAELTGDGTFDLEWNDSSTVVITGIFVTITGTSPAGAVLTIATVDVFADQVDTGKTAKNWDSDAQIVLQQGNHVTFVASGGTDTSSVLVSGWATTQT